MKKATQIVKELREENGFTEDGGNVELRQGKEVSISNGNNQTLTNMKYLIFFRDKEYPEGSLKKHLRQNIEIYTGIPDAWGSHDDLLEALEQARELADDMQEAVVVYDKEKRSILSTCTGRTNDSRSTQGSL